MCSCSHPMNFIKGNNQGNTYWLGEMSPTDWFENGKYTAMRYDWFHWCAANVSYRLNNIYRVIVELKIETLRTHSNFSLSFCSSHHQHPFCFAAPTLPFVAPESITRCLSYTQHHPPRDACLCACLAITGGWYIGLLFRNCGSKSTSPSLVYVLHFKQPTGKTSRYKVDTTILALSIRLFHYIFVYFSLSLAQSRLLHNYKKPFE